MLRRTEFVRVVTVLSALSMSWVAGCAAPTGSSPDRAAPLTRAAATPALPRTQATPEDEESQRLEEAQRVADAIATAEAVRAEQHVENARDYCSGGEFGLALEELRQALALAPTHSVAEQMEREVVASATAQAQEAEAAAAAAATAAPQARPDRIPGLNAADAVGYVRRQGFTCSTMKRDAILPAFWNCELNRAGGLAQVDVIGVTTTAVGEINFVVLGIDDGTAFAIMAAVAAVPYTGSNPERVRRWIEQRAQVGQDVQGRQEWLTIGDVEFVLRRDLRILRIIPRST